MLLRAATFCMIFAFTVSKLHNFREYWNRYNHKFASATALLSSTVCQHAEVRMKTGEFNNCHEAEIFVHISPLHRAIYSVAEEMHVCGNDRCAILYMDITDRLSYLFVLAILILMLVLLKLSRDWQHQRLVQQCAQFHLPTLQYKQKKEI